MLDRARRAFLVVCMLALGPSAGAADDAIDLGPIAVQGSGLDALFVGLGAYDFPDDEDLAAGANLEYRFGRKLVVVGPALGLVGTTDGSLYGYLGLYVDVAIGPVVITPEVAAGGYRQGDSDLDLGGTFQFRSSVDAAYGFAGGSRLGVRIAHISNAGIYETNTGVEELYLFYTLPLAPLFWRRKSEIALAGQTRKFEVQGIWINQPSGEATMARAYASSVIDAPIEEVWARIRDFNGLPDWHPGVETSVIEDSRPSDQVGCVRNMTLAGGGKIRERLLEMSDLGHHYSYSILESPLPVANYRATLRLRRISDGNRTYGEWSASFDADPPEKQVEAESLLSNAVFQGGFDALKKHFGG